MKRSLKNINIWTILWVLWTLVMIAVGSPVFATTESEEATPLAITSSASNPYEVSYVAAENAVIQALTEKGVGDKVSAVINGRKSKPIFAYSKPVTIEVRGLKFDKQSGHWDASLAFLADEGVVSALPISGHFDEMVEVAVLKREMRNGDVIQDNEIEIRDFSLSHTRTDTVTDLSALIGKTPLRTISPFRPIRAGEIVSPSVMKKDAMVQMHYSLPGMEITTTGQAMTAGAKGDVISVRNSASKKIVRAVIEDSDTVAIFAPHHETSALTGGEHVAN